MPDIELTQAPRLHRIGLLLLLLGYLILGVLYAVQTPVFESPDESSHLQVIRSIALNLRDAEATSSGLLGFLPPYQMPERRADSGPNMAWAIGFHDPPLYYAPPLYHTLAALVTLATSSGESMVDLPERLIPSPSWEAGYAPVRGSDGWNKNIFVHLPTETLSESALVRAATLLRGFSIAFGAVTIWCTYALARQLHPNGTGWALVAAAIVALNPQFIAGHTGVSNDPLTIAICSATFLGMVTFLRRSARWHRWALLGVLAGLGAMTKQSALLLVPVCGVAALVSPVAGRRLTRDEVLVGAGRAGAFGVAAALAGGSWYLYNLIEHGDLLGTAPHYAAQVPLARFGWEALVDTLASYWAAFGWALITLPGWMYAVAATGALVALAGLVRSVLPGGSLRTVCRSGSLVDHTSRWGVGLLALSVALNIASFVGWAEATGAPYGRLLFPTAAPAGVLLAWGLTEWRGRAFRQGLRVLGVLAVAVAVATPWLALRPAFRTPYRASGMPRTASVMEDVAFVVGAEGTEDEGISLQGYDIATVGRDGRTLAPGGELEVTLYWAAGAGAGDLVTVWAQLSGIDPEARVAEDTRWLGGTLYPSSYWRVGDVVAHTIALDVPDWAATPSLYWLRVGLQDGDGRALPLVGGANASVVLGPWRLRAGDALELPATATPVGARFGEAVRLTGYEVAPLQGAAVEVRLYWEAEVAPAADYTVFVHGVNDVGELVAQHDGPPAEGAYPTSWWLAGDVIEDRHTLVLPSRASGEGTLYVGMYDPATGDRLPAMDSDGMRFPNDAVPLSLPAP